ncbi:DMT family transporter [Geodermatophilus sp. DSM 44513]|uniref:DMT family transporter n=1 Tax=Geodermatophilus sp. DSM 44513 TaxID=1528104 RepID=UPI001281A572|nr:DMT family transporter [Geodermatophilus sp. DSM 44513]WNV76593.1 DMT family transporter [Geodermatophilus sp. DSM 44513]
MSRRGWALFLTMSVVWGVPYLLIKVAVEDLSPVVVVFGRCLLGAALLLPWTVARGRLRPALRRWRPLLAFTVLEMTGPWLLIAYAEQTLSSSLTGLLIAAVPFAAALAARLSGDGERLGPVRLLGMGLGVAGIAVLLGLDVEAVAPLPLLAMALVVVGYATAPLIVTRSLPDVSGVAASAVALTVTTVVYAPFAVPRLGQVARAPSDALLAVLVLGVVCTALALAVFFALIREVGPQRALVITFLNPGVAVLLGVLVLDEPLTLGLAVGLPVVVLGCVLATRRSPARRARAEDVDVAVP